MKCSCQSIAAMKLSETRGEVPHNPARDEFRERGNFCAPCEKRDPYHVPPSTYQ